jgi:ABC-type transport system involved in multi-copper enzyme maturation permease subunit
VRAIAWFEFATKFRRISTYVYFAVFTALAALWMAAAGGAFAGASIIFSSDKVFINSPYAIAQTVTVLGLLGVVVIAAFMGRAVQQDFEYQTFHFFFASPIAKHQYFVGRFLGAAAILMVIFLGIAVGVVIGVHFPGVDATRVGPWSLGAFAKPYAVMLLPNIFFLGACFFGLAALSRRMLPVYIAGVVVLIGYIVALRLLQDIDNRTLAAMIDPLGSSAMGLVTRYWSLAEKNTRLIPIADEVLWNRALWIGIGVMIFGACYARFRMSFTQPERKRKAKAAVEADEAARPAKPAALPVVTLDTRASAYLRQLPGMVALHLRETVKNVYFGVIVLAGALFILGNAKVVGSIFGTNTYPVTYQVIDFASGQFGLIMLIITALYSGELVWRERDARMAQIADSLPAPTWLGFIAKLLTLMGMQALLQLVVLACGLLIQVFSGYYKFELGQYLFRLFVLQLPEYWMIAAIALAIHSVVNHKYLGHFLVVLYYMVEITASGFGWDHRLYHFGNVPSYIYSDMNRYGHFLGPIAWFMVYWGAGSVLLLVLARLFWVRGTDTAWRVRLRIARSNWTRPLTATAATAALVFVATGAWIFYNTNVLHHYRDEFARDELNAQYEKLFKPLSAKPQPKVVASRLAVDIFPYQHHARFNGTFTLKNKSDAAIPELYVNVRESAIVKRIAGSIALTPGEAREDLGWRPFRLARPLAPGETMTLDYELEYPKPGFSNSGADGTVIDNGTFLNSSYLPVIGYQERGELTEDRQRRKHGLEPRERMHDIDDAAARMQNYVSHDGDWIDLDVTVSTAPDQIALAPGYLQREWTENGRRYFHYKMDVPILNFYAFLSARYSVKRDVWRGGGKEVPIEVYYQPGHEYNLERMIEGVKDSLDYYTKNFSPYQHHQVRILEFPRYERFAQAFPNTIPFSESIGFIAKVDANDPKDVDYPYYVTAHEIAHQWWAHQVIGANVQGATMMSETLAQYSALMVMKKKYGDAKMKRFLKYELDSYLVGRATERKKELPLFRNENQPYIHYRKGSLAMYQLQDAIGEDAVNRALASYIRKVAYQEPPYTTSRELLAEYRAVTPPEFQYLIADLFETITLYENRAVSAAYREKAPGRYEVTLKVSAKKMRADEGGTQKEEPMDDWVDIGVLGPDDKPLYLKKHRVRSGESSYTIEVAEKPVRAGIDPVVKLVDRRPDDNTVAVSRSD